MLRLIVNKAKQHFNNAVERAERQYYPEALAELNDALELNSRFAEALVLKGTVLARMERFEEAREAWEKALALNPQAARAHRYVGQLGEGEAALPLLRRARAVVYGAAGLAAAALLIVVLVLSMAGDSEARDLRAGWSALSDGDLARARMVALSLEERGAREDLLRAVDRRIQAELDAVASLARGDEPFAAVEKLKELEDLELSEEQRRAVAREEDHLQKILLRRLEQLYEQPGSIADAREMAPRVVEAFPAMAGSVSRIQRAAAESVSTRAGAIFQMVINQLENWREAALVLSRLEEAKQFAVRHSINDELEEKLVGEVYRLSGRYAQTLAEGARQALERNQGDLFREMVSYIEQLPGPGERPYAKLLGRLKEEKAEAERERLYARLKAALEQKNYRDAMEAAGWLQSLGVELENDLAGRVAEAREQLAIESYYELMDRAAAIEAGDLTPEGAREVLQLVEYAVGVLPPRLQLRAEENLLFFAARAHRLLGEEQAAEERLQILREQYPQSPYLLD